MSSKKNQKRVPQRIDGIESKSKLKSAAIELFSKVNYSDVSVSQITKLSKLSTGAFYQYYINKDELFREIIEEFFDDLSKSISGKTLRECGLNYLKYAKKHRKLVKVVHLNEYAFEWIRNEYEGILMNLSEGFGLSEIGHFYFWSPLKFVVGFSDLVEVKINDKHFVDLVVDGIVSDCPENLPEAVFDFEPKKHIIELDERRERILSNAESLFGRYGYEKTQVYDIAKASGIAVGTFYLYFANKIDLLRELVRWINKGLRYNVKRAVERNGTYHRLAQEIAGLYAFVQFFRVHSNMYKIVRESQSIDREIAKEYYTSIYKPYIKAIRTAFENEKLSLKGKYDFEEESNYLVLMLMSLGHYLGERFLLTGQLKGERKELEGFLEQLYKYICRGLEVSK
ncbi:MAG: TetR/AcrR family transcriptional regulator [Fervidobacterium sp.]